jgi:hypothetical protein
LLSFPWSVIGPVGFPLFWRPTGIYLVLLTVFKSNREARMLRKDVRFNLVERMLMAVLVLVAIACMVWFANSMILET